MTTYTVVNDKFTEVRVLSSADGKYGLQEFNPESGEWLAPSFRYSTLDLAEKIASRISNENNRLNDYETSCK